MVIFGWLILAVISCYVTFMFIAGNVVSMGFSGKSIGVVANILLVTIIFGLWFWVFKEFPFEVSLK